jgi:hypothetical protein
MDRIKILILCILCIHVKLFSVALSLFFEAEVDIIPAGTNEFFPAFGVRPRRLFTPEPGIPAKIPPPLM